MEKKNIFETISAVMRDVGVVGKDSVNPQQNYKYRGIDAVMNALHPAMEKHGLFVLPDVIEQTREERQTSRGGVLIYSIVKVNYKFYAPDGSYAEATVIGEGMDSGDKATNKAMSAAFKYALFQVFCIPTEEMKDSEIDSPQPAPKTITKKQAAVLESVLTEKEATAWLEHYKKDSLEKLSPEEYANINEWKRQVEERNGNKGDSK